MLGRSHRASVLRFRLLIGCRIYRTSTPYQRFSEGAVERPACGDLADHLQLRIGQKGLHLFDPALISQDSATPAGFEPDHQSTDEWLSVSGPIPGRSVVDPPWGETCTFRDDRT